MKLIYVYIKYFDFFVWDWGGGWLYKVFVIWWRRLFLLCEGRFANIMFSSYVLWLFWKWSSFIFWIHHRMVLLPCLQRLIFHLIVFRFSHWILQWAKSFLVLTYLHKMYCIDTHLTYIYCKSLDYQLCVWYYNIPVCCESVSIVLKLYFNLFFHINSISNESLITCIMVFGFHEKNDPFVKELVTVFNSTVLILLIPRALTFTKFRDVLFSNY